MQYPRDRLIQNATIDFYQLVPFKMNLCPFVNILYVLLILQLCPI